MGRYVIAVLIVFSATSPAVQAYEFICGAESSEGSRALMEPYRFDPTGDEMNMMLIFVGFPNDAVPDSIREGFHDTYIGVLADWVERFSYNRSSDSSKLTVSTESRILLPPGESFQDGRARTWAAAANIQAYRDGSFPPDYPYLDRLDDFADWGNLLNAEILYQIWEAYGDQYPDGGLFPRVIVL